MTATTGQITQKLEAVIAEPDSVALDELEGILTDGYARTLELEVERARINGRMRAALLDAGVREEAAQEARDLFAELQDIESEAAELRGVLFSAARGGGRFSR